MSTVSNEIPLASDVGFVEEKLDESSVERPELTEEERVAREAFRTEQIKHCVTFVQSYIEGKAPGKIRYRGNVKGATDAYIFKFSPPAARGIRTRFFSQVSFDTEQTDLTRAFELVHFRPKSHSNKMWYFPILYLMNGRTKNENRTFEKLGLTSVQTSITQLMESKGYQVTYVVRRVRPDGTLGTAGTFREYVNYVLVSWGPPVSPLPVSPLPVGPVLTPTPTPTPTPTADE